MLLKAFAPVRWYILCLVYGAEPDGKGMRGPDVEQTIPLDVPKQHDDGF